MKNTRDEKLLAIAKYEGEFWCSYAGHFASLTDNRAHEVCLVLTESGIQGIVYLACNECYQLLLQHAAGSFSRALYNVERRVERDGRLVYTAEGPVGRTLRVLGEWAKFNWQPHWEEEIEARHQRTLRARVKEAFGI